MMRSASFGPDDAGEATSLRVRGRIEGDGSRP